MSEQIIGNTYQSNIPTPELPVMPQTYKTVVYVKNENGAIIDMMNSLDSLSENNTWNPLTGEILHHQL